MCMKPRAEPPRGIVLAGGSGSRLYPLTLGVSKQLLPVYDKPMVYYPLSVLMLAGIREVLLITTAEDLPAYQRLLGQGGYLGMDIRYAIQERPGGIAEAFDIGADFIGSRHVVLVLGDNIFYGQGFTPLLREAVDCNAGATLFAHYVMDPRRFGVVTFGADGSVQGLWEKPQRPASQYAITGLYCFDSDVVEIAADLVPSARGEREIIDVLEVYRQQGRLQAHLLGRGFTWLDAGTPESLLEAGMFVQAVQHRQGMQVACLEEIAWRQGWIDEHALRLRSKQLAGTSYGRYLYNLLERSGPGHDPV